MPLLGEMRQTKRVAEADLLKRPGVTGVDIGPKITKGVSTGELSIRVYVAQKKDVPADQMIPATIDGAKTDVIERRYVLHPLTAPVGPLVPEADTGTYDPLKGGISIGPCRAIGGFVYAGTLGAVVRDNATHNPLLLSNFHVMAVDTAWQVGDPMAQPSRVDGGTCPASVVGTLQRAQLGGQVDCAVASHDARGQVCEIAEIGSINATGTATVGMAVRKRGRTTGLTHGTVESIDLTVQIDYGNGLGLVTLTNQIGIAVDTTQSAKFGDHGDSGSVVVDAGAHVVGLYFAGSDDGAHGVANPIAAVLTALNVSMCAPVIKVKDAKIEKIEIKDHKPEKIEIKEKREKFEKLEKIEIKEAKIEKPEGKELKDIREGGGKGLRDVIGGPGGPVETPTGGQAPTGGSSEERLSRLEAAVAALAHFIRPELRPDLSLGALGGESDAGGGDLTGLSQQLAKQASDAKQAKDSKDVEKLREA